MAAPRLIVGLGNPGAEHEADRHNAGFWLVDRLLSQSGASARREPKFFGDVAKVSLGKGGAADCWVIKPQTYMNLSGQAVAALARFYRLAPDEILVAYDELDLPPGSARLKLGGSSTHNGLRDITAKLGGPGYWRLRLGIGHPRPRRRRLCPRPAVVGRPEGDRRGHRPGHRHPALARRRSALAGDPDPAHRSGGRDGLRQESERERDEAG